MATAVILLAAACVAGETPSGQRSQTLAQGETYPVELVFVLESGERVADIPVEVLDARSREIFKGRIEGHILNLALSKGEYRVTATLGKRRLTKTIRVQAGPVRELLVW